MNKLILSTLPGLDSASPTFHAIDRKDAKVLGNREEYDDNTDLRTFEKGLTFP